jgi:protein-S-isoprenylcysteine O-methyltransferase Ste14
MAAVKTLIFTIVVPGTVTVLVPYLLLSADGDVVRPDLGSPWALGLVAMLLGAAIYLWCAWDFAFAGRGTPAPIDPPRELVVRGLYRFVRNPMYVGVLLALVGEAALFRSVSLLVYAALVFMAVHLFVVLYEEPTLQRQFGESYARYRHSVPRWISRVPRPRQSVSPRT